jgi:hypothetical protein
LPSIHEALGLNLGTSNKEKKKGKENQTAEQSQTKQNKQTNKQTTTLQCRNQQSMTGMGT